MTTADNFCGFGVRSTSSVTSSNWFGLVTVQRTGFFRRRISSHLLAFSSEDDVQLIDGPVFSPFYPEIQVGNLSFLPNST